MYQQAVPIRRALLSSVFAAAGALSRRETAFSPGAFAALFEFSLFNPFRPRTVLQNCVCLPQKRKLSHLSALLLSVIDILSCLCIKVCMH